MDSANKKMAGAIDFADAKIRAYFKTAKIFPVFCGSVDTALVHNGMSFKFGVSVEQEPICCQGKNPAGSDMFNDPDHLGVKVTQPRNIHRFVIVSCADVFFQGHN